MIHEIPIEIFDTPDSGCHLFIEAHFSEYEKGWLIIDTGANRTVFDKKLVSNFVELKDIINEEISAGINASIENSQDAILNRFQLGKFVVTGFKTVVISLEYLNSMYNQIAERKIWGLIGGDFLKEFNCIISYKGQ